MTITQFLTATISGDLSLADQEAYLRQKDDIAVAEVVAAVRFLQERRPVRFSFPDAIDVCGTGGSGLARINTSTLAAFILATMDIPIAKHGNRAASGRFGSFDLLEAMDIVFSDQPDIVKAGFYATNLAFLFAPFYHPVMKHFAPVRKAIGKPTFFNILGPLISPADVTRQIIGTAFADKMQLIADVCQELGKERVLVVRGEDGLDEVTISGETTVVELRDGTISTFTLRPEDFGLTPARFDDISGGDRDSNLRLAEKILSGKYPGRHTDLVLVNVALALYLTERVSDVKTGYDQALSFLESGAAMAKAEQVRRISHMPSILLKIRSVKEQEIQKQRQDMPLDYIREHIRKSDRDFASALMGASRTIIAEIKKASPSAGMIATGNFRPDRIARDYESAGAAAVSVLTDSTFFGGHPEDLRAVRNNTTRVPILCKDFIIDSYQVYAARFYGADAILLIAALLSREQIVEFSQIATALGMDVLCEVHTARELEKVLTTPVRIIGINNRNLHTFDVDVTTTVDLAPLIPADRIIVSESGIASRRDLDQLPATVQAVLVGTALMQSDDKKAALRTLLG
ncbi:MAG: anthranilate phosphoribosyltransferase [Fidelibacterota bacterium]